MVDLAKPGADVSRVIYATVEYVAALQGSLARAQNVIEELKAACSKSWNDLEDEISALRQQLGDERRLAATNAVFAAETMKLLKKSNDDHNALVVEKHLLQSKLEVVRRQRDRAVCDVDRFAGLAEVCGGVAARALDEIEVLRKRLADALGLGRETR